MDTPTYHRGQQVALRFAATSADSALYTLMQADGTPTATTWRPRGTYSMQLPRAITVWAEVTATPGKAAKEYTLNTPLDLGRLIFHLTATELAACDRTPAS